MATTKAPVLSLSTIIQRQTVAIDGKPYEMRSADELPWMVYRGHANLFQRAGVLMTATQRTPAQEKQLEALLKPLIAAILIAPKAVLAKLNTDQRWAVLMVFSALLPTQKTKAGASKAKRATPNGVPAVH